MEPRVSLFLVSGGVLMMETRHMSALYKARSSLPLSLCNHHLCDFSMSPDEPVNKDAIVKRAMSGM